MDSVTGKEASLLILLVLIVAACDERFDPIRNSARFIPCFKNKIQSESERNKRLSGGEESVQEALEIGNALCACSFVVCDDVCHHGR
jgi:hypothetical protein